MSLPVNTTAEGQNALRLNLYEIHARERLCLSEDYKVCGLECLPHRGETQYILVTLAIPARGYSSERRFDPDSHEKAILPLQEHSDWVRRWEHTTGWCHECTGTGEVFSRWSKESGTEYRRCGRCNGTGEATSVPNAPSSDAGSFSPKTS